MKVLLAVLSIVLTSCSSLKPTVQQANVIDYQFDYGFYIYDLMEATEVSSKMNPKFVFPTIPGAIFGNVSDDILYVSESNGIKKVNLSLPKNIDEKAVLLTQTGIAIHPSDSKILRLGTFHIDPISPGILGGGGFINSNTNNPVILIYVSRSSSITGSVTRGQKEITHNIYLEKPGWNWIESKKIGENKYQLTEFVGNVQSIKFMVLAR